MLVGVADAAILTAATGVTVMLLILLGLVVVVGSVVAARMLTRRYATTGDSVARRRA